MFNIIYSLNNIYIQMEFSIIVFILEEYTTYFLREGRRIYPLVQLLGTPSRWSLSFYRLTWLTSDFTTRGENGLGKWNTRSTHFFPFQEPLLPVVYFRFRSVPVIGNVISEYCVSRRVASLRCSMFILYYNSRRSLLRLTDDLWIFNLGLV